MDYVKIELTKEEAKLLYSCLNRTSAKGEMLDIAEKVQEIILKQLENKN